MNKLACILCLLTPILAHAGKSFNEGKGGTWDCAKDATVAININNATFTFTGKCDAIAVNGNGNKITIATVASLAVNGNDNTATVTAVDAIATNGNKNTVTYGKDAKPKVGNNGNDNKVGAAAK